jgi:hypothetical protein
MDKYTDVLAALTTRTGVPFRPAKPGSLAALRKLDFPETIIAFYAEHEPAGLVEVKIRLWHIKHIVLENAPSMPGMFSSPVGFPVFATTTFGDTYCFNLAAAEGEDGPPVVILSHEIINQEVTSNEIAEVAKPVAHSLLVFLEKMVAGTVDEEPIC